MSRPPQAPDTETASQPTTAEHTITRLTVPDRPVAAEPRVTVEMGGTNILIRATAHVGRSFTTTIADAINAATDADTTVVIDPDPIPCGDDFAAYHDTSSPSACTLHDPCRPAAAEVAAAGIVRLRTERRAWLLDVGNGALCQHDGEIDVRFLGPDSWMRVVAVCVTPSRLIALLPHGGLLSASRAHDAAA